MILETGKGAREKVSKGFFLLSPFPDWKLDFL
jgi:hypothetical protein